jgi:putative transposase
MTLSEHPLFFDAEAEFSVSRGHLPHWEQVGTVCFITFRTWDSMPREAIERLHTARAEWLRAKGIDATRPEWKHDVDRLPESDRTAFRRMCSSRWEDALDTGLGACALRAPHAAQIVGDSLSHFDGTRYVLFDFVVMPNHVHLLASFPELGEMRRQCESWKRFIATRLNRLLGRTGRFWEDEAFDHLVRSEAQFEHLRDYIAANPARAGLRSGEFVHYSKPLPLSTVRVTAPKPPAERAGHTESTLP